MFQPEQPKYMPLQLRLWRTFEAPEYVDAIRAGAWGTVTYEFDESVRQVTGYTLRLAGEDVAGPDSPVRKLWATSRTPGFTVGIEAWAKVQPITIGSNDAAPRWAYLVYPRLHATEYGPWLDPYGVEHPSLAFHSTDEGHPWGSGPHPVRLDTRGNPARLEHPLTTTHPYLMMTTTMNPDDALAYTAEVTS